MGGRPLTDPNALLPDVSDLQFGEVRGISAESLPISNYGRGKASASDLVPPKRIHAHVHWDKV